ncbi:MAG: GNAT family N-acetyltransferase [Pseudomonadota bacterium]
MILREAVSDADYVGFGALISQYVAWCRERYVADPWLVDMAFSHQSLDLELEHLPVSYGPPNGRTLIALDGDETIGGVAYRVVARGACEMKRMYVIKRAAGRGIGRQLCLGLLDLAKANGFKKMVLDTSRDMTEAIGLYRSCGFTDCAPYIDYPERMKPMMLFMEKTLEAAP